MTDVLLTLICCTSGMTMLILFALLYNARLIAEYLHDLRALKLREERRAE